MVSSELRVFARASTPSPPATTNVSIGPSTSASARAGTSMIPLVVVIGAALGPDHLDLVAGRRPEAGGGAEGLGRAGDVE